MYKILYQPKAEKFIDKISFKDANRVVEKLELLAKNPFEQGLNVKKITNSGKTYRLRIGGIRAIYFLDISLKIIYIHEIDFRGNIY